MTTVTLHRVSSKNLWSTPLTPLDLTKITVHRVSTKALRRALEPPGFSGTRHRVSSRLMGHLSLRVNAVVPYDELFEAVWGDDPRGGPIDPANCLALAVMVLRRGGRPIVTFHARGLMLKGAI